MKTTRVQAIRTATAHRRLLTHWLPLSAAAAFALTLAATQAFAAGTAVLGEKQDSGLGELPHYSQWADKTGKDPMRASTAGEKLDNGLGDLPHYSKWVDKSGKNPMGPKAPDAQRISLR